MFDLNECGAFGLKCEMKTKLIQPIRTNFKGKTEQGKELCLICMCVLDWLKVLSICLFGRIFCVAIFFIEIRNYYIVFLLQFQLEMG